MNLHACRWLLIAFILLACQSAQAQSVTVFAAASLKNALDEAAAQWKSGARPPSIAYGASSTLARQIENGAPAHVFISADQDWMDYLAARGLIVNQSRKNLFGNTLVLIGPSDKTTPVELKPGVPLAALLGNGRLALADPQSVPAGKYAKAALERIGAWTAVSARLAPAENVRAALALVARGETPLGIVYGSDAAAEPKVKIVATFDSTLHPAIVYPAAVVASSKNPEASALLAYLASAESRAIFRKHGFKPLD